MPLEVTRTIASVGSWIVGSGTSSTRTSRLPWNVTAFMRPHVPATAGVSPRRCTWPQRRGPVPLLGLDRHEDVALGVAEPEDWRDRVAHSADLGVDVHAAGL